MRTSQQPGPSRAHYLSSPRNIDTIQSRFSTRTAVSRRSLGWIALTLSLFMLLGISLAALADPGNTSLLPLVMTGESQKLIANDDHYQTFGNIALAVSANNGVLANDTGPAPLRATLERDVTNGKLTLNEDGSFHYQPDRGFIGKDRFIYHASTSTAVSNPALVTLNVTEDPLNNAPRIVTGEISFTKQIIGTRVKRAHFAYAADFDEDGDLDVVATHYGQVDGGVGGMVPWFENDGADQGSGVRFEEKILDPDLAGAYPAHIADVDLDGHIDVLVGGYDADTFAWYRNDGRANFKRINIDTAADGAHSIVTIDLDKDGDNDLVTSGQDGNFVSWYENEGENRFKSHIIDSEALAAKRAEPADLDGDGDIDVLGASFDGHEIAWYENDGKQQFSKHVIDNTAFGAYYVEPADIDGDGDIDMFTAHAREDMIAWYRNDGPDGFAKQIVDDSAIAARTVVAVDMDRDGDVDGLAASVDDSTVAWHSNNGNGSFVKKVIDDDADGAYSATAVDMDFDGDFDVITASRNSGEIALHTHYRAHKAEVNKHGTLVIDSKRLLTVSAEEEPSDLVYTITDAPDFGEIRLNGKPVRAGDTFTQKDVNGSRVTYAHTATNITPDGFSFKVAGSGKDGVRPATGTFAIKIT